MECFECTLEPCVRLDNIGAWKCVKAFSEEQSEIELVVVEEVTVGSSVVVKGIVVGTFVVVSEATVVAGCADVVLQRPHIIGHASFVTLPTRG